MRESKPSAQHRVPAPATELYRDQDVAPEPQVTMRRATLHVYRFCYIPFSSRGFFGAIERDGDYVSSAVLTYLGKTRVRGRNEGDALALD
jgi:hypothetical protein